MSADEEKEIDKEFRQNRWQFLAIIIAYGEFALIFLYSKTGFQPLEWICEIGLLLCIIPAIYAVWIIVSSILQWGKQAIEIRMTCNDRLFDKIDYIEKNRNSKTNMEIFAVLNYYYHESDEMQSLIEKGEIERLLTRQDYLQHKIYSEISQSVSVGMNFIFWAIPVVLSGMGLEKVFDTFFTNITTKVVIVCIIVVVLGLIVFYFSKRGQLGIYSKEIIVYELELLKPIIRQMEDSMHIDQSGIGLRNMQQLVINTLKKKIGWIKISSKKKEMSKQLRIIRNMKFEQPPSSMYMLMHFENNESFIYYKPIVTTDNYKDDYVIMSEIIELHKKEIEKMYNKIRSKNIISYCETDHHTG